ncbi:MAG TPA: hypothetical protein VM573_00375, partial [Actinomycetota bacterium]|nr:hypothetical protein [Actinomycetota bacterium]
AGTTHTVTCAVTNGAGVRQPNEVVNVEFSGANDPDGSNSPSSPDASCTTNNVGECSFQHTAPQTGQNGTTTYRAWVSGHPMDATEGQNQVSNPGEHPEPDSTDVTSRTWTSASPMPTSTATTPGQTPGRFEREITLEASASIKTHGRVFQLSGSVRGPASTPPTCLNGVTVQILRDIVGGDTDFTQVKTTTTDNDGVYSVNLTAARSASYVARVEQPPACDTATSVPSVVEVRKRVKLRVSDTTIRPGQNVRFNVRVFPCGGHRGDRVLLQKSIRGTFGTVARQNLNDECRATFVRRQNQDNVFRVRAPKTTPMNEGGTSKFRAIEIR